MLALALTENCVFSLLIGILSTSFDVLGGYRKNVECGYLPEGVKILKEGDPGQGKSQDEGRGMAQVIYASAKGVNFAFWGAANQASFALGIGKLVEAGVDVIVDDLDFNQPIFQPGQVRLYVLFLCVLRIL